MGFRRFADGKKPQNLQTACSSAQNIMQNSLQQPENPLKTLK